MIDAQTLCLVQNAPMCPHLLGRACVIVAGNPGMYVARLIRCGSLIHGREHQFLPLTMMNRERS